jgi:hypothetical protein
VEWVLKIELSLAMAIAVFAVVEMAFDAESGGILAVASGVLESLLRSEIIREIINVFLIADASVTAVNTVAEKTGQGITEGVLKDLLTTFDITVAIEGEMWTIYKMFEKEASKEKGLFYFGLSLAVASTVAVMLGDTLNLHGGALEWYDIVSSIIGLAGVFLMYSNGDQDTFRYLTWTGLLEWIVGWSGLMSALVKMSADGASGWR